jgi:hypothetical protein
MGSCYKKGSVGFTNFAKMSRKRSGISKTYREDAGIA